jgi:hypothetical protein
MHPLINQPKTTRPRPGGLPRLAAAVVFLGVLAVHADQAAAEFFTFVTTVSPPPVITGGGVTITLTPQSVNTPGDNLDGSPAGTDVVFGSISVTGLTLGSLQEPINIPYTFQMSINNYAEGNDITPIGSPTVFNISGTLLGSVGAGKKVNIANNFSQTSITQLVGGENYRVDLFSYVPPGVVNAGAFGAHVEVIPPPIPEPGTFVLLSLGLAALATPALRRWRRIASRSSG